MQHIPPANLGEKTKIFVCGMLAPPSPHLIVSPDSSIPLGPPGQVNAIAGKKDGMKQGALSGILKELGYNEDQVRLDSRVSGLCADDCPPAYLDPEG